MISPAYSIIICTFNGCAVEKGPVYTPSKGAVFMILGHASLQNFLCRGSHETSCAVPLDVELGVEKRGRKENRGGSRLYCQLLSLVATVVASVLLRIFGAVAEGAKQSVLFLLVFFFLKIFVRRLLSF